MEIIKKIINLDELKSHRAGIIDFVPYGNITPIPENGNYGGFVYDSNNVKYLDVLKRYNTIREILRKGIFLKRSSNGKYVSPDSLVDSNCGVKNSVIEECIYDFTPCDINDFIYNSNGYYYSNKNYEYNNIVLVDDINKIKEIEKWWLKLTNSSGNLQFCKENKRLC